MLFNSLEYIFVFLPPVIGVYYFARRYLSPKVAQLWLIAASVYFYSFSSFKWITLLLVSILLNYCVGRLIQRNNDPSRPGIARLRLALLWGGISLNLVMLGYFKYADFFLSSINAVANSNLPLLRLALPLAISFYTFQQISFLADSYTRKISKTGFIDYCFFVLFFPQLIAGPILRFNDLIPQFRKEKESPADWHTSCVEHFGAMIGRQRPLGGSNCGKPTSFRLKVPPAPL